MPRIGKAKKTGLLKGTSAKYLDLHIDPGNQNIQHKSKRLTQFECQAFGTTGLLNDHCYPRGKSFVKNIGQKLMEQPRRLAPANQAADTTAGNLARAAGYGGSRSCKKKCKSAKRFSRPDLLGPFASKSRLLALTGMT